jgi:16S rRNA (guanine527-N7)-methyltransferase
MSKISQYALPLVKKNGYFVAYKSKKALEELDNAKIIIKNLGGEVIDIIEYTLPLEEVYERNLVCIKKL